MVELNYKRFMDDLRQRLIDLIVVCIRPYVAGVGFTLFGQVIV